MILPVPPTSSSNPKNELEINKNKNIKASSILSVTAGKPTERPKSRLFALVCQLFVLCRQFRFSVLTPFNFFLSLFFFSVSWFGDQSLQQNRSLHSAGRLRRARFIFHVSFFLRAFATSCEPLLFFLFLGQKMNGACPVGQKTGPLIYSQFPLSFVPNGRENLAKIQQRLKIRDRRRLNKVKPKKKNESKGEDTFL